mmetsp:Transcript_80053/g.248419  ORF Transcript_80053/g.248419 Transcript_80053/m.248419 type:complete len:228 (+) Transcript_80053:72-755(+)
MRFIARALITSLALLFGGEAAHGPRAMEASLRAEEEAAEAAHATHASGTSAEGPTAAGASNSSLVAIGVGHGGHLQRSAAGGSLAVGEGANASLASGASASAQERGGSQQNSSLRAIDVMRGRHGTDLELQKKKIDREMEEILGTLLSLVFWVVEVLICIYIIVRCNRDKRRPHIGILSLLCCCCCFCSGGFLALFYPIDEDTNPTHPPAAGMAPQPGAPQPVANVK